MESSGSGLYSSLRKIIGVIDELRDVGLQQYINLPRIAVLGTQSSGKSSLLEMIVGVDFLPRGDGVVTRRPLELRLVHTPGLVNPYGEFEQMKGHKFTDFNKVRDKINQLTDEVAGTKKGIIDDPIILTVHGESCPDLTVIDLPGITRIPLANSDQPKDIEKITKEMALRYLKDPRTIILCVVAANADISTSDALQIARDLDPHGSRTIGVITKIDIMDRGTNAKNMLLGNDIPLKLGYVGVKGRSQQDVRDGLTVKKGLEIEKEFFASHPVYSTMPPGHIGTSSLTSKLTTVLYKHIRSYLPEIYKEINLKTHDCEDRLKDLGTSLPSDDGEKLQLLWQMTTKFCENFKNQMSGRYDMKSTTQSNDISGASKIRMLFNGIYSDYMTKNYRATGDYDDRDIQKAIILHEGDTIPGFPSIDAFMYLLQPQLEKLKEPALDLLNGTYNFLEEIAIDVINKQFYRFPMLIDEFTDMVCKLMQNEREFTREMIESIVDAEQNYLFTNDADYLSNRTTLIPKENTSNDPTKVFISEMRNRIDSYFALVCRNVRDSVPKAIGHYLVRATQDKLLLAIYEELNKNKTMMTLLSEPSNIAAERDTLKKTLETLKKAAGVMKKDPDLASAFGKTEDDGDLEDEKPTNKPKVLQKNNLEVPEVKSNVNATPTPVVVNDQRNISPPKTMGQQSDLFPKNVPVKKEFPPNQNAQQDPFSAWKKKDDSPTMVSQPRSTPVVSQAKETPKKDSSLFGLFGKKV